MKYKLHIHTTPITITQVSYFTIAQQLVTVSWCGDCGRCIDKKQRFKKQSGNIANKILLC